MATKKFVTKHGALTNNIQFVDVIGSATQSITLSLDSLGTLSFDGINGQLFSVTDNMSGTIFSVNDISGIPSIEVLDDGTTRLAEFSGNVLIGTNTDDGANKLQVLGNTSLAGEFTVTDTGTTAITGTLTFKNNDNDYSALQVFTSGGGLSLNSHVTGHGYVTATNALQAVAYNATYGASLWMGNSSRFKLTNNAGTETYIMVDTAGLMGIGTATPTQKLDVVGNIAVSGTVDGRDIASDGAKLDGIEVGATADQTKADIDALGINAATLDGIDSTGFSLVSHNHDTTYVSQTSNQALHATDALSIIGNTLYLNKADGTNETIDLSIYLDDTNLSRITSGVYNAPTQSLVFTRDDLSTFSVDASMFFDDTNLVTSVDTLTGAVDLSTRYLGISAKAADSDKLDGLDSTQFLRSDLAINTMYPASNTGFRWVGTVSTSYVQAVNAARTGSANLVFSGLSGANAISINMLTDSAKINNNEIYHVGNLSKAVIDALAIDATTLDSLDSTQFLRSDIDDTMTGNLTVTGNVDVGHELIITNKNGTNPVDAGSLYFQEAGTTWGTDFYGFRFNQEGSANQLRLQSGSLTSITEIMTFNRDTGLVGIGTISPTQRLDVVGNIAVSGTVDGRDLATDGAKLDGIEAGATADQTGAEIKALYEAELDTNAFTDALLGKLNGIEAGATADQTKADIDALGINAATLDNLNSTDFTRRYVGTVAGVDNVDFTTLAFITGNSLSSMITMSLSGTANSVVVSVMADIIVNHAQDIYIRSEAGGYTQVTLKILSDDNDDYYIQAKTNGINPVSLRVEIVAQNDDVVSIGNVLASGTTTLEHLCDNQTVKVSGTGSVTPGFKAGNTTMTSLGFTGNLTGTATNATNAANADKLDNLDSTQFLRSDIGGDVTAPIAIKGDVAHEGITVHRPGVPTQYIKMDASDGSEFALRGVGGNKPMNFRIQDTTTYGFDFWTSVGKIFGIDVNGNVTLSGTVDGRDLAVDGAKLDGIEANATADQTKADIDALGINAATLDSIDSTQFLRSDVDDTMAGKLTINNELFVSNPAFGGFPLAPNMIHNSYMNRVDGSNIPLGWGTTGLTIEAVSPFTKGFEGRYVSTAYYDANLSEFTADIESANGTVTYWFGNYNKGTRIQRGGLGDGWHSTSDGKILKVTGVGRNGTNHSYITMPMESNNLGARWLFSCWVKITKGAAFGAGSDSGYFSLARGDVVTKATTDANTDGWYRYTTIATSSQITSLDNLAFSLGFTPDVNGDIEAYIVLPYLANVNYKGTNLDVWSGSVVDKLMRQGLYIHPLNGNISIGAEVNDAYKLNINGNVNIASNLTIGGTVDGRDIALDGTKLDGIEANATADQTGAEIKTLYEAELDTNAFTDALLGKLNGIESTANNYVHPATHSIAEISGLQTTLDTKVILNDAPAAPTSFLSAVIGETIEVTFSQSTTTNCDRYEVWNSLDNIEFNPIAAVPREDFAATISVIDDTFYTAGTIYYRVYAIKNGVYSIALTGSKSFTAPTLDVTNLIITPTIEGYHITYTLPTSRFYTGIQIWMDADPVQLNLSRATASMIYSGTSNYFYYSTVQTSTDYHQFWVEVI